MSKCKFRLVRMSEAGSSLATSPLYVGHFPRSRGKPLFGQPGFEETWMGGVYELPASRYANPS